MGAAELRYMTSRRSGCRMNATGLSQQEPQRWGTSKNAAILRIRRTGNTWNFFFGPETCGRGILILDTQTANTVYRTGVGGGFSFEFLTNGRVLIATGHCEGGGMRCPRPPDRRAPTSGRPGHRRGQQRLEFHAKGPGCQHNALSGSRGGNLGIQRRGGFPLPAPTGEVAAGRSPGLDTRRHTSPLSAPCRELCCRYEHLCLPLSTADRSGGCDHGGTQGFGRRSALRLPLLRGSL